MQHFGHTEVGVVNTDEGGVDRMLQHKVFGYEDGRGMALVDIVGILGVGQEGDATLVNFFNATGFPYQHVLVAFDGALQFLGYLFCCELHVR